MATFRSHKESGKYMILDKTAVEDPNLSLKAKGLHAYMMSKADNWQFYLTEIVKNCKDGRDSVSAGIEELEKAGYIVRTRQRDDKGRLGPYEYDVYEVPVQNGKSYVGKSEIGKPETGKTEIGKPVTNNNKSINNKNNNNNSTNNDLNDLNDIELVQEQEPVTNHSNHTNHLTVANRVDDLEEQKEVALQNMPPMIAGYLMKFEIDEIHIIKSSLLKAKSRFNSDDDVMAMTLEDIEEHIVNMLKRINQKRKKSNESIESLERYIFTSAKKVFYSNAKFFDDDEPLLDPSNVIVFQGSEITNLQDYERAGAR